MHHEHLDLSAPIARKLNSISLTSPEDVLPTSVVDIPSGESFSNSSCTTHDLFVLTGSVSCANDMYEAGTYVGQADVRRIIGGPEGARLLCWSIDTPLNGGPVIERPEDRAWVNGVTQGTSMVSMNDSHHKVILTSWQPGSRMKPHNHPGCEDFFVLTGEIIDGQDRYPAGSWRRWRIGEIHAPLSRTFTRALVINGYCLPDDMSSKDVDRSYID
ncbi:cupin domain-containing protein [Halomonas organivorans]|uniref:ChrR-like cupin domain-containing protein n=1 Tax=Halomonas organivorans TaxID=257772 RepID=A0A7W5BV36_9GAMM|nr:cupin domain-containing protein [Halomonas organivorans]MBB3139691.1 hypothetical protein [Halomonas organivorans]